MPLDANEEIAVGVFESLYDAVVGPRGCDETIADPIGALVVVDVNFQPAGAGDRCQPTVDRELNPVAHVSFARRGVLPSTGTVGKVLDQRATSKHVEQLQPPTDSEDRDVPLE